MVQVIAMVLVLGGCTSEPVALRPEGHRAGDEDCKSAVSNVPEGYETDDLIYLGWEQCIVEYDVWPTLVGEVGAPWATNTAWACGVFPSGTLQPPQNEPRTWMKGWEWTIGIGGDASYQPKANLAAALAGVGEIGVTLGTQFGLNGNWSYTESSSYSVTYQPAQAQCWTTHARVLFVEARVVGTTTEIESRFWWQPKVPANAPAMTVDCGKRFGYGEAKRRHGNIVQHAPKTPQCEIWPGTPFANPDPWEGMRITPCCQPLPGCDADADPPCCGQTGGQ